ncbi:MAG: DUF2723 domain-containing protein [Candidatus Omnitrophota bacterium]
MIKKINIDRDVVIYSAIVFLLTFLTYLKTLCPTIYGGDSGEFVAVVHTMGIAHPPGHPAYILIAKLFSFFPFGNAAYRLNLMSAFFGAASCALMFRVARAILPKSGYRNGVSLFSALAFGFSLSLWNFSLFAETYSLYTFFMVALILLMLKIRDAEGEELYRLSSIGSAVIGLGIGVHPAMIFGIPALAAFLILYKGKKVLKVRYILGVTAFFLLGFSVYLYLPIRAHFDPQFDVSRITSLKRLIYTLLASQYRTIHIASRAISANMIIEKSRMFILWVKDEFTLPIFLLFCYSIYHGYKKHRKLFLFMTALPVIVFLGYLNSQVYIFSIDRKSYLIAAVLVFSLFIAVGADDVIRRLRAGGAARKALSLIFALALGLFLAYQWGVNYAANDKSDNYLAYDMGKAVLDTPEPGSVLFLQKDWISFALAYLQAVEGYRADVMIYNRNQTMFPNLPGLYDGINRDTSVNVERAQALEDEFIQRTDRPVYFNLPRYMASLEEKYRLYPKGLLYKVVPADYKEEDPRNYFEFYKIRNIGRPKEEWDLADCKILIDYYFHLGDHLFEQGMRAEGLEALDKARYFARDTFSERQVIALIYTQRGYHRKALEVYMEQIKALPGYPPSYRTAGVIYWKRLKEYDKAIFYLNKYLELEPRARDRQDVIKLIDYLGQLKKVQG